MYASKRKNWSSSHLPSTTNIQYIRVKIFESKYKTNSETFDYEGNQPQPKKQEVV
jgi:hypothetical protein